MKINKKKAVVSSLLSTGLLMTSLPAIGASASVVATKDDPNIVLILADDLGYSDISCYGSDIPTPNIDRIAENGVRLTQFCNTARCSPSRASILTGLYPHQAGMAHLFNQWGQYTDGLNNDTVTIADVLGEDGYNTAHFGKWHLGTPGATGSGFDVSYTMTLPYFQDVCKTATNPEGNITDYVTEKSVQYIKDQENSDKPFFAYVAHNAPHFPLSVLESDVELFHKRYNELHGMPEDYNVFEQGWDVMREAKYERMVDMGIIDADWALPSDTHDPVDLYTQIMKDKQGDSKVTYWNSISQTEKDWYVRAMEVYAGMITSLDRSVGEILDTLEETGQLDNTVVIFMSDNGGNSECPIAHLDTTPGGKDYKETSGHIGYGWASYCNTPFSMYKHYIQQGGIATPFIISWPEGIDESQNGTFRRSPAQLTDLMATFVDITDSQYPTTFNGYDIIPMQGTSIMPIIENDTRVKEYMYWEHEGNCGIRWYDKATGKDWKLVRFYERPWELYDMINDGTEIHDLSAEYPEIVEFLQKEYGKWAKASSVLPLSEYELTNSGGMGNPLLFVAKSFDQTEIKLSYALTEAEAAKLLPCSFTAYSHINTTITIPVEHWTLSSSGNGIYKYIAAYTAPDNFSNFYFDDVTATVITGQAEKTGKDDLSALIKIASLKDSSYYLSGFDSMKTALDSAMQTATDADATDAQINTAAKGLKDTLLAMVESPLPAVPDISWGIHLTKTTQKISWGYTRNASSFTVLQSRTKDGTYTAIKSGITDSFYTVTVDKNTDYYYKVSAQNSDGSSAESKPFLISAYSSNNFAIVSMPDITKANGLLWYSFDEISRNGLTQDSLNRYNSVSQSGNYLSIDGISGGGFFMSDVADRILVTNDKGTDLIRANYTERTVSLYFKPYSLDGLQMLYCQGGDAKGASIRLNNGTLEAAIAPGGVSSLILTSKVSLTEEALYTWFHVALVFDNGNASLYLNGVEVATGKTSKNAQQPIGGLVLGVSGTNNAFKDSKATYNTFFGIIDDLRVYNTVCTPTALEAPPADDDDDDDNDNDKPSGNDDNNDINPSDKPSDKKSSTISGTLILIIAVPAAVLAGAAIAVVFITKKKRK